VTKVYGVHGEEDAETYLVNISLPNQVIFPGIRVTKGKFRGADVLIGMDIIASGDFSVTNCDGFTTFSYRHPSIKHVDYVKEANAVRAMQQHAGIGPRPNKGPKGKRRR
jgi:hypothetical protein